MSIKTMPVCTCGGFDYIQGAVMVCPKCGGARPLQARCGECGEPVTELETAKWRPHKAGCSQRPKESKE